MSNFSAQKYRKCPFCRHGELRVHTVEQSDSDYRAVQCLNCSAEGPLAANDAGAWRLWNGREHVRHVFMFKEPVCACGKKERFASVKEFEKQKRGD